MKIRWSYLIVLFILPPVILNAQQVTTYYLHDLHKQGKLNLINRNISSVKEDGRSFIRIAESKGDGVIWLPEKDFRNGKIEITARGKDIHQGSFYGVAFHYLNDSTYDGVYCRPFNFRAKDSIRKIHAVQYVSYPNFDWQRLRAEYNGQFEKGIENPPDAADWVTLSLVIKQDTVTAYINNQEVPSLVVQKLNRRTGGKVGITGFNADVELIKITHLK